MGVRANAGAVAVPVNGTDCGPPKALSVTVTVPLRAPAALGSKSTLIEQLAPAAIEPLHGLMSDVTTRKFALPATLVILSAAVPVLVRVIVWTGLAVPTSCGAKLRLAGDRLTTGAGAPVPLSVALATGAPQLPKAASSITQTLAAREPGMVGVKVTETVQLTAGLSEPHMLLSAKSRGSAPVRLTIGVALTIPVLDNVRVWAELVSPTL